MSRSASTRLPRCAGQWPGLPQVRHRTSTTISPLSGAGSARTAHGNSRVKVGTIFEDSPISLDKWLCASLDARQLQEWNQLLRSRACAWRHSEVRMVHAPSSPLGVAEQGSLVKLGGNGTEVEVDETFIGGKARDSCTRSAKHVVITERRAQGTRLPRIGNAGAWRRSSRPQ